MSVTQQLSRKLFTAATLVRAGVIRPTRPDKLARVLLTLRRWGETPAAGYTVAAIRQPEAVAIIDERGETTFREVHEATNRLARGLLGAGVRPGDSVAIMCRNHRWFVHATVACSKLGAHALYLNTAFAAPQIEAVVSSEDVAAVIHDHEFAPLLDEAAQGRLRFVAWPPEPGVAAGAPTLDELSAAGDASDLSAPAHKCRVVILTSGTTGTPKGAQRHHPESLDPAAALLSTIPLRAGQRTLIASPMFHSWGLAHFALGMSLGSTLVLRRRFEPEATLRAAAEHGCAALIVAPVMLQRLLELSDEDVARHDLSSLRIVAASGSALPGDLALRVMDRFGDVLYNLYGTTEVAWATVAGPRDLRTAPGTAGRPPRGTVVKLLDEAGHEVRNGEVGRIFVGNEMTFDGYTGGGGKDVVGGLMSSGDLGHLDPEGRLFVDGRDDEMIVSGGENVFPREVEDLLSGHEGVDEVAVLGVPDPEFGQRLRAFVVRSATLEVQAAELKAYVADNLARFKVPREVVFVAELPRTATGKVLKRELAGRG